MFVAVEGEVVGVMPPASTPGDGFEFTAAFVYLLLTTAAVYIAVSRIMLRFVTTTDAAVLVEHLCFRITAAEMS